MKRKLLCLLIALVITSTFVFACCNPPEENKDNIPSGNHNLVATPLGKADEPTLAIHYQRKDQDYDKWGYWIWSVEGENPGTIYKPNNVDDFGSIAVYPLSEIASDALFGGIGLIVRRIDVDKNTWIKDTYGDDRMVNFDEWDLDENNYYHIYIKSGEEYLYASKECIVPEIIKNASFSASDTIQIRTTKPVDSVSVFENNVLIHTENGAGRSNFNFKLSNNQKGDFAKSYSVTVTFRQSGNTASLPIAITGLYGTEEFGSQYNYDGELGAIYSASSTTFKVWSPISTEIKLNLYAEGSGGTALQQLDMTKGEKGVWSATVNGELSHMYYTYTVKNSTYPNGKEIVDPYAKSAGVNGVRGQIVNFADTNPTGWESVSAPKYDRKELVVWETHVADVTSSSTWGGSSVNAKKFLGLIESGTTYTDTANNVTVKTGWDHIKELGVNAVQLIPIFDQANDEVDTEFNWGYNPLNYNVLEGCYSSDPTDGYKRINEFKQVVQGYNNAGIGIIMDVVYNHTNGLAGGNFDVLMPGYYYRYTESGKASSGSGCGNDTASEHYMYRKFMIDSACFWAKEYKLKGFRFDLMGLHDLETMNLLVAELKKIDESIVVYGEPWNMGTASTATMANQNNIAKFEGFGGFNDQMRDALIKGGYDGASTKTGWITGTTSDNLDMNKILYGMKGATYTSTVLTTDANKAVSYVTCHDNTTLYDRIKYTGVTDETVAKKMAMLANSIVLTSNGTSFVLAGEEFLRTKGGDHNSYASSYEVNELDYALKAKHLDMFTNYQKLIALKKSANGLHLDSVSASSTDYTVSASNNNGLITVTIKAEDGEYKVVHANGKITTATANFDGYTLYLDTLNIARLTLSSSTQVLPYQTIIGFKANA